MKRDVSCDFTTSGKAADIAAAAFKWQDWIARMAYGDRKSERVDFERGIPVYIMGIDGTWRRDCLMVDVSQTGARLLIKGSLEGLDLKEFFLLLSSTGLAYRRCQLVRVAGDQIGVAFLTRGKYANSRKAPTDPDQAV
jgi:hypothetical protein